MRTSKRWKDLKREIETLRKHFLPRPFDPLGVYTKSARVQAYTRAFLVLSHAEIESYLEGWAKELARASEAIWVSSGKVTTPLAFLLSTGGNRVAVPDKLAGPNAKDGPQRFADMAVKLFQKYYTQINDNNGIKERNLWRLFMPLGVPASAFGSTLLPNLDNLAALRGTHAHQSIKAVPSTLDPETQYNNVTTIVKELEPFDQWLLSYRRRIR